MKISLLKNLDENLSLIDIRNLIKYYLLVFSNYDDALKEKKMEFGLFKIIFNSYWLIFKNVFFILKHFDFFVNLTLQSICLCYSQ